MEILTLATLLLLLIVQYGLVIWDISKGGRIRTLLEYFYLVPLLGLILILLKILT
jgi:hypothetical protein